MQTTNQPKNLLYRPGHGYSIRPPNRILNIILHSTNGTIGSLFENEVKYLLHAGRVSAHYLVSKQGEIIRFLDDQYAAWHVGNVNNPIYSNNNTIGIEVHYTPKESKHIPKAIDACTEIVRHYKLLNPHVHVEMHRSVAVPQGRKIDPSFFSDRDFDIWRDVALQTIKFFRIAEDTQIYTAPTVTAKPAIHITNQYASNGIIRDTIALACKRENTQWLWLADGVGFVHASRLAA